MPDPSIDTDRPQPQGPIGTGGGEGLAVGAERYCPNCAGMAGQLVQLLASDGVPQPHGLVFAARGDRRFFRFPFETIEAVAIVDDHTLIVLNDNNFPFSAGRTPGAPDNNEIILVRLDQALGAAKLFL